VYFKRRKTGGISINSTIPLTQLDDKMIQRILQVGGKDILGTIPTCNNTKQH
jgi:ribosome-interacting GTPase 1